MKESQTLESKSFALKIPQLGQNSKPLGHEHEQQRVSLHYPQWYMHF